MDTWTCIHSRRSIRKYLDLEIPKEKIGMIIEAGIAAPSSGNLQNWSFTIIKNPESRKQIADACFQQNWMATAPVHILVCGVEDTLKKFYGIRGERLYSIQNCAAAIQNMLLMANELDIGACWVGAFDETMIRRIVKVPDNVRPQAIITLGISDEKPKPTKREQITYTTFLETHGNKIEDMDMVLGNYAAVMQRKVIETKTKIQKHSEKAISKLKKHSKKLLDNLNIP